MWHTSCSPLPDQWDRLLELPVHVVLMLCWLICVSLRCSIKQLGEPSFWSCCSSCTEKVFSSEERRNIEAWHESFRMLLLNQICFFWSPLSCQYMTRAPCITQCSCNSYAQFLKNVWETGPLQLSTTLSYKPFQPRQAMRPAWLLQASNWRMLVFYHAYIKKKLHHIVHVLYECMLVWVH